MKKLIHGVDVTRFLNSRNWLLITVAAFVVATIKAVDTIPQPRGVDFPTLFSLPSPELWIDSTIWSDAIGATSIVAIATVLFIINNTYNLLRSISLLFTTIFITATAAVPDFVVPLNRGEIVALTIFGSLYPLFSVYQSPRATRRVFLTLAMVTTALILCCQSTACIVMISIFIAAIGQMRIMSLKSIIAIVIGIATPIWILWGFGIIDTFTLTPPSLFTLTAVPGWITFKVMVYLTVMLLMWLSLSVFNLVRIYNYNARLRAYNGVFTLLGIASMLLMCIDPANLQCYITLFAGCLAIQAGHFFAINHGSRSWIGILLISLPFWIINLWFLRQV